MNAVLNPEQQNLVSLTVVSSTVYLLQNHHLLLLLTSISSSFPPLSSSLLSHSFLAVDEDKRPREAA